MVNVNFVEQAQAATRQKLQKMESFAGKNVTELLWWPPTCIGTESRRPNGKLV